MGREQVLEPGYSLVEELGQVPGYSWVVGQEQVLEELLVTMFARGHCLLVGVPGSGKSTIGRALAAALGVEFRDTDTDVEVDTGRSIADIFVQSGEPEFRRLEEAAVAAARQWKFEPALHEGKPVPVFYLVTINFRLE